MNDTCIYTRDYRICLANGLNCPHCGEPLSPHAVERRDPTGEWSIVCQHCHHDVVEVTALGPTK
jgi:hypothetical protein